MSGNSLESLLKLMEERSVTEGWGAISVVNRERLNRLLEQQYIKRFNTLNFLPPLSGTVVISDDRKDFIELENVAVSQPLLSFSNASSRNSTAILTMRFVTGRYSVFHQSPGAEKVLLSASIIKESQEFILEMEVDLAMVVGEVDRQGKVKLDLAKGSNFRCNLAGNDEVLNTRLASYFKESFDQLPPDRTIFLLGMLDLLGYSPLTPKSFKILTQAAPGAKVRGALNYGAGAVVCLIQLLGNSGAGSYPPSEKFPYMIPDDLEPDGSNKYSAALVVSEAMIPYIEGNSLDPLNNMLFPGENFFDERERHQRRDLGVFGNVSSKQTLITLEPAFTSIKAGDTQQFTLRNWKGDVITASNWRAVSLRSHTAEGHGTITDGLYTAASSAYMESDSMHVVVTADYVSGDITYTASSLVRVDFDSMTIAPRVAACSSTAQSQPVVLTASTLNNETLSWKLLAPEYGTLTQNGDQRLFTANARARAKSLAVQQVEASGTEKNRAAILLLNGQQLLRVTPPYVPAVRKSVTVKLTDDPTLLPGIPRRWKVVGGGGTVDSNGHFTAPAQGITASSVVQCEIVRNGVVLSSGYSSIDLSEREPVLSWDQVAAFTIKVPGGPEGGRRGSLYANGYQQARVHVVVTTTSADGKDHPLSVTEKASIKLVDDNSGGDIKPLDEDSDGIPEGDSLSWYTHLRANRFNLAYPGTQDSPTSDGVNAVSHKYMFIHSRERAGAAAVFHVEFQADATNKWVKSTDISDLNNKIDITPIGIPRFETEDYDLKRQRVEGGSGNPQPGTPHEDDDFNFHLRTLDYWTLRYIGRPGTTGAAFETLEFVPVVNGGSASTSMFRPESERLWELHASYTGYYFKDLQRGDDLNIRFDEAVKKLVTKESLSVPINSSFITPGALTLSLHRSDRTDYVRLEDPSRAKLNRDLGLALIDKNGNPHKLKIAFRPRDTVGNRNYLLYGTWE